MEGKLCSKCGKYPQLKQKTICKECDRIRAAEKRKNSIYGADCKECGKHIDVLKNKLGLCSGCFANHQKTVKNETKYIRVKDKEFSQTHTKMASILLGKNLDADNLVTHHLDEVKHNNDPINLVVISRSDHSKLHVFLREIRSKLNNDKLFEERKLSLTRKWFELHMISIIYLHEELLKANDETRNLVLDYLNHSNEYLRKHGIKNTEDTNSLTNSETPDKISESVRETISKESSMKTSFIYQFGEGSNDIRRTYAYLKLDQEKFLIVSVRKAQHDQNDKAIARRFASEKLERINKAINEPGEFKPEGKNFYQIVSFETLKKLKTKIQRQNDLKVKIQNLRGELRKGKKVATAVIIENIELQAKA